MLKEDQKTIIINNIITYLKSILLSVSVVLLSILLILEWENWEKMENLG